MSGLKAFLYTAIAMTVSSAVYGFVEAGFAKNPVGNSIFTQMSFNVLALAIITIVAGCAVIFGTWKVFEVFPLPRDTATIFVVMAMLVIVEILLAILSFSFFWRFL